jgi:hypothetical protein
MNLFGVPVFVARVLFVIVVFSFIVEVAPSVVCTAPSFRGLSRGCLNVLAQVKVLML